MIYDVDIVAVPEQAVLCLRGRGPLGDIGRRMSRLRELALQAGLAPTGPLAARLCDAVGNRAVGPGYHRQADVVVRCESILVAVEASGHRAGRREARLRGQLAQAAHAPADVPERSTAAQAKHRLFGHGDDVDVVDQFPPHPRCLAGRLPAAGPAHAARHLATRYQSARRLRDAHQRALPAYQAVALEKRHELGGVRLGQLEPRREGRHGLGALVEQDPQQTRAVPAA
jgi:hypothetical protein